MARTTRLTSTAGVALGTVLLVAPAGQTAWEAVESGLDKVAQSLALAKPVR
jgi:hypothetical protein